jgi:CubicO group peptidase (beta-lactamase class C family)
MTRVRSLKGLPRVESSTRSSGSGNVDHSGLRSLLNAVAPRMLGALLYGLAKRMQRLKSSYSGIALGWKLFATAILMIACITIDFASARAAAAAVGDESGAVNKLFKEWDTQSSPGCAVAVMKDGRIVYEHGYGMADLDHNVPITTATVFNVGSIAKQFTGAAILMLAQDGELSIDDPIKKYIAELPDFGVPITLREMLAHTSGLRDYEILLHFDGWRLDSPDLLTNDDILYVISRQKELNFPPGTDYAYSNTNYMLLAQVVSRLSGQSFPDFAMARIFQPLGMKHTHFRQDHGEVVKNLAYSYIDDDGVLRLCLPNYDTFGATNLMTTVEDLARWNENFFSGRVGGLRLVQQLQQPGQLSDGTHLNYAPGEFVGITPGGIKWAQSGAAGDAGYRADALRLPDRHLTTITLCNLGSINPTDLNVHVADLYLGGEMTASLSPAHAESFHPDAAQLASYVGIYTDAEENYVLKLEQRGDALWAESYTGPNAIGPSQLEATGEGRFRGLGMDPLVFSSDHRSAKAELLGMPSIQYTRVAEYHPSAAELREFEGDYASDELDIPYHVAIESNGLVLRALKLAGQPITPITNDLFIGGDRRVRFTRDARGKVTGFLMSGFFNRVQNLRFERTARR